MPAFPSIAIATICINESEHIDKLYEQHKTFPNLMAWVFVEGADKTYAKENEELVTDKGLSKDATSFKLKYLSKTDKRVMYIPKGIVSDDRKDQAKIHLRNCYLEYLDDLNIDYLLVIDADEFYSNYSQSRIYNLLTNLPSLKKNRVKGFTIKQRHIWKPENSDFQLFEKEIVGGYWSVPHTRLYSYIKGMRYTENHNTPMLNNMKTKNENWTNRDIECIHLGFASSLRMRKAKHKYYIARGEGITDKRQMYVDCRAYFENYEKNSIPPHNASIIDYNGQIPECFLIQKGE